MNISGANWTGIIKGKEVVVKVYFIGAGPGDPELLTLKGRRLLDLADVVIYAGSLVNPGLLNGIKAEIHNSASMTLDDTIAIIERAVKAGKLVVRLHTGDPAFYSAISEQIERSQGIRHRLRSRPGRLVRNGRGSSSRAGTHDPRN